MRTGFQLTFPLLPILLLWTTVMACIMAPAIEAFDSKEPHLVFDAPNAKHLPIRFRQPTDFHHLLPQKSLDFTGLDTLQASASGQFSRYQLENMIKILPVAKAQIWIIDLRQESHGFINYYAFSWYGNKNQLNEGLKNDKVLKVEQKLLSKLAKQTHPVIYSIKVKANSEILDATPMAFNAPTLMTEEDVAQELGLQYQRFFITDHKAPEPSEIDRFVDFHQARAENQWLHFHCRGGKGRATTFFVMTDMLKNASHVAFEDIIHRHGFIGPKDLMHFPEKDSWKYEDAKKRLAFLEGFYEYARSGAAMAYSDWLSKQV